MVWSPMKSNRRILIVLAFASFCLGTSVVLGQVAANDKLAIVHGPYLQEPTENSITVVWVTSRQCLSMVEYATGDNLRLFPQWGSVPLVAASRRDGLIDANVRLHKIRIEGLKPGKTYRYRVISKEIVQFKPYEVIYGDSIASGIYQFKTLDAGKGKFSFYVFQDVHEDANALDSMLRKISWDDVDLVFFNGDMIHYFQDQQQLFSSFVDVSVSRFAKEIPFIYIRGNHETRGLLARNLIDYFPTADGRFYYSFNHGPIHFIVLDTGEDKADSHPVYAGLADFDRYRRQQAQWLKRDLQGPSFKQARFRIVLMHMPPWKDTTEEGLGWSHAIESFGPLLNKADIDLVLCGHTHQFTHIKPNEHENSYPIIIGAPQTSIRVDVTKEQLKVTTTNKDGQVVDTFCMP